MFCLHLCPSLRVDAFTYLNHDSETCGKLSVKIKHVRLPYAKVAKYFPLLIVLLLSYYALQTHS
jgi:hypothetical protein